MSKFVPNFVYMAVSSGQERYNTITTAYYRGADAIILVYDICAQDSFNHLKDWLAEVNRYCPEGTIKTIVGNKCDKMDRTVSKQTAKVIITARDFEHVVGITYEMLFNNVRVLRTQLAFSTQKYLPRNQPMSRKCLCK